jgi:phosphoribosylglycinamide formyltransferase-1
MLKIGVLVSGGGTNLQAIIDNIESGYLSNCSIVTVVSSRPDTYALERARKHNIEGVCIAKKGFPSIEEYDLALISQLESHGVDLVVMAGFLSILGETFTKRYEGRIINVHPALIPSFCGKGYYGLTPHIKALEYGVKVTGATVHFVELEADEGPIILQKAVYIKEDDTPEILQKRVMEEAEWDILPRAIKLISENKIVIEGRRVKIFE